MKGITIVVCCYNSAKRLPPTIQHLAKQQVPAHIPWEVIVVDNNCKDDTVAVAQSEWQHYGLSVPFQIVHEPTPGLAHAREKGIFTAQYDYVIFCDDDNWLQQYYVRIAYETMESDPKIGICGGQSEPVFEVTPPDWFKDFWGYLALGKQGIESGDVTNARGWIWGAGMIIRKNYYIRLKELRFNFRLTDRKGIKLVSGHDSELCLLFKVAGCKLFYLEDLKIKHYITPNRININYLIALEKASGVSHLYLETYKLFFNKKSNYFLLFLSQIKRILKTLYNLRLYKEVQKNASSTEYAFLLATYRNISYLKAFLAHPVAVLRYAREIKKIKINF